MHGIIYSELTKYVETRAGHEAWGLALRNAGVPPVVFLATSDYPDDWLYSISLAAASLLGSKIEVMLEDFGAFMAPALANVYTALVRPEWTALDLIERTEATIHQVIRTRNPAASPPRLVALRLTADSVEVVYDSPRRLCALARGIVRGIGELYRQPLVVTETECLLRGDPACRLLVQGPPAGHGPDSP